jgi:6-phosphogluconolactonase
MAEIMKLNGDQVDIFADVNELTVAAAERFALLATKAAEDHDVFTVALSGGSTPKALYRLMAGNQAIRSKIPWSKVHAFFGDERHVPPDHAESNFRMANEAMLQALRTEQLHVHRVLAELSSAAQAADQYETELREFFEPRGLLAGGFPRFDLIFLGMGPDGHTASLFPNSTGLNETTRWVVSNWVEKFQTDRITMTFPVLDSAAEVILLVTGAEKAPLLAEVLQATPDAPKYPVQRVRPRNGIKRWMLDASAAAGIETILSGTTQATNR